jgi:predicted TPR repeat methyltransferase
VTTLPLSDVPDPLEQACSLLTAGRAADAVALLRGIVGSDRGGLFARLVLVRALLAVNDVSAALSLARELASLNLDSAEVAFLLGEALARADALPAAIAEFNRALRLDPSSGEARFALAQAWLDAGEPERAEAALEAAEDAPQHGALRERVARMREQQRSDAGYVRHLFDQFSANYDEGMRTQLRYAAPEILRELFSIVMPLRSSLAVLDLGCGTGLAGEAFKDVAARLEGIDLSPKMIERARSRGIYSSLTVGDMETLGPGETFDLVVAADSLVYLGDLAPLFRSVSNVLKPAGQFLFTVEANRAPGFQLGPKRRWRHAESYLREMARGHSFEIVGLIACSPRSEAGVPVEGLACAVQKEALAGKVG